MSTREQTEKTESLDDTIERVRIAVGEALSRMRHRVSDHRARREEQAPRQSYPSSPG